MSLVAFAIRVATVRILRGCLPAGFNVIDSPVDAVDALETASASGIVAVYTGQNSNKLDGEGFFAGEPKLNIDLQIFLPQQTTFAYVDASGDAQTAALDTRGKGTQVAFDIIERAFFSALAVQADVWSQLFGGFVQQVSDVVVSAYLVETSKVKAPAMEIRLACDVLQEPVPGAPASAIWAQLLAAMEADTGADSVAPLASWVAAAINAPGNLSQPEMDRVFLGISEYAAQAINLTATTVSPLNDPPPPLAEQVDTETVNVSDVVSGS